MARALVALALGAGLVWAFFALPQRATSAETDPPPAPSVVKESRHVDLKTEGVVPQSFPLSLSIEPGVLPMTEMNPDGIRAVGGVVAPADNRPVFRTDSNLPGTDSPGTSFIVGHNYVDASGADVPFSALARVAIGDAVVVVTETGTLVYDVRDVFRVPKDQLAARTDLLANVPGRLILETCDTTPDGRDTYDNLVVITQLI